MPKILHVTIVSLSRRFNFGTASYLELTYSLVRQKLFFGIWPLQVPLLHMLEALQA